MTQAINFPIDINIFRSTDRHVPFDVYLKISHLNYAHVFSKETGVDFERLNQYRAKGVTTFYVTQADYPLVNQYIQQQPEMILNDPKASQQKKAAALLSISEQHLTEIMCNITAIAPIPEDSARSAQKLVKNFVQLLSSDPQALSLMIRVANHGEYLYAHALAVSIFSIFLAKASGTITPKLLEICGMGGLLHDIGLAVMDQNILETESELDPAQWREMRQHPQIGLKLLEGLKNIPEEVRTIVAQHHEEPRGTGYPSGLRASQIFKPAKIVSLADGFHALISQRPHRKAFTVEEALQIIRKDTGKWDYEMTKVLLAIFGRKPSGRLMKEDTPEQSNQDSTSAPSNSDQSKTKKAA